jgi:hypothetical protein
MNFTNSELNPLFKPLGSKLFCCSQCSFLTPSVLLKSPCPGSFCYLDFSKILAFQYRKEKLI